ncbi:uncharacterized protein EbC_44530 [Erwinia billingiae Eb661]|uniref:Uncharacterized protein n=1 Tax=Erwinia billingiae (strain Eb661) TaxID=634500 RepID=D8MLF6_ERWBE|nr:hypothetical protein [Erwinia billingiae]CAX61984.1 uncharacterized protein EbC_44530 [Erwinia billingiae Eb661]
MIMLTIEGVTHALSVEDATNLALAVAAKVDEPGQAQRFQGTGIAFSVACSGTVSAQWDEETLSPAGIYLTDC